MTKVFQIEIPRRSKKCAKGEEEFAPGDHYFSILIDNQENGFCRSDFCIDCWEIAKLERVDQIDSYWKSRVSSISSMRNMEIQRTRDEKAFDLLRQALQNETLEGEEDAFLLALYLARRRLLALRKEKKKDNVHLCIYEAIETEEMLCVKKMHISSERIVKAQERLAAQLRH